MEWVSHYGCSTASLAPRFSLGSEVSCLFSISQPRALRHRKACMFERESCFKSVARCRHTEPTRRRICTSARHAPACKLRQCPTKTVDSSRTNCFGQRSRSSSNLEYWRDDMKIVLTSSPAAGHVNPLLVVAGMLQNAGHETAIYTGSLFREKAQAAGSRF